MSTSSPSVPARPWLIWLLFGAVSLSVGVRGLALSQIAAGPLPHLHTVDGTTAFNYAQRLEGLPQRDSSPSPAAKKTIPAQVTTNAARAPRRESAAPIKGSGTAMPDLSQLGIDPGALPVDIESLSALLESASESTSGTSVPESAEGLSLPDGAGGLLGGAMSMLGGDSAAAAPVDLSPIPRLVNTMRLAWFGDAPIWAIAFQLAAGALSMVLLALLTTRIFGRGAALLAVVLVGASATMLAPELIIGPAPLTLLLVLTTTWLLTRASDEKLIDWIAAGAALGALALTDPGFGPAFGVAIVLVRVTKIRINDRLRAVWPLTLGGLIVVLPALSTVAESLIAGGAGGLMNHFSPSSPSSPVIDLAALLGARDPAAPLGMTALLAEAPLVRWMPISMVVIAPLAVAGLLTSVRSARRPWPLLLALAWVIGRMVLLHPTAVDRVLLLVLLAPWAAAGVQSIAGLAHRQRRVLGAVAAVAVIGSAAAQTMLVANGSAAATGLSDARLLVTAFDLPRERQAARRGEWNEAAEAAADASQRFAALSVREAPAARMEMASRLLRQSMYLRRDGQIVAADEVESEARVLMAPVRHVSVDVN